MTSIWTKEEHREHISTQTIKKQGIYYVIQLKKQVKIKMSQNNLYPHFDEYFFTHCLMFVVHVQTHQHFQNGG
jgi:transposase-like protein